MSLRLKILTRFATFPALYMRVKAEDTGGVFRRERLVERIAFGSCTSYHHVPQPVWASGVIPSQPHAWVWVGDLAYMDDPNVDCDVLPAHRNCNCTADWLHIPPHGCSAGDLDHSIERMEVRACLL